jgi:hypothetical protein
MPRPFHLVFPSIALLAVSVAGCKTSTPYTRMYSPRKGYYVAPPEKKGKSAEEIIKATETPPPGAEGTAPGLPQPPPPALPGEIAPPPVADPLNPFPAAPAAPEAPAIPGIPPAAPPL